MRAAFLLKLSKKTTPVKSVVRVFILIYIGFMPARFFGRVEYFRAFSQNSLSDMCVFKQL